VRSENLNAVELAPVSRGVYWFSI